MADSATRRLSWALLLALFLSPIQQACSRAKPPEPASVEPAKQSADTAPPLPADRAAAEWARQLNVVERAAAGHHANNDFGNACIFFEELTGIVVPGDGQTLGWFPTKRTPKAIPRLKAWFEENHPRLYWDESAKKVKVRPAPG